MTDQFAFLEDKGKAAIAAMSLGVLLLLPASLGFGGTIIEEAYGQFNLPLLEEEEPDTGADTGADTEDTTTTPTTPTTPTTHKHPSSIHPRCHRYPRPSSHH